MVRALKHVEFDEDIYSLGLRGAIDASKRPDLAEKILKVRHEMHGRLQDPAYAGLVEPFNVDKYNKNLSVAENLLFGTPVGKDFDGDNLAGRPVHADGAEGDRHRPATCCAWASASPRPWSSCSPACRPTIRCSSSTASSRPTSCPTSACCCNGWAARAPTPCPRPTAPG
jgi:hypothetical protein